MRILYERSRGAESWWDAYIRCLPPQGSFNTLVHWSDAEMRMDDKSLLMVPYIDMMNHCSTRHCQLAYDSRHDAFAIVSHHPCAARVIAP
eukprot:gene52901-32933_t